MSEKNPHIEPFVKETHNFCLSIGPYFRFFESTPSMVALIAPGVPATGQKGTRCANPALWAAGAQAFARSRAAVLGLCAVPPARRGTIPSEHAWLASGPTPHDFEASVKPYFGKAVDGRVCSSWQPSARACVG